LSSARRPGEEELALADAETSGVEREAIALVGMGDGG
jgi:hypothetical protein